MKVSNIILILPTLLGAASADTNEAGGASSIAGYSTYIPSWSFEVTPGGPTVILNGTAQEVYAQLLNLNPNYEAQLGTIDQKAAASAITRRSALLHRKRQHQVVGPYWDGDWKCGYGDKGADIGAIRVGVHYLRGLNGRPANGPGPGNCGRVSCSYNSAIWWCNDNPTTFTHGSWNPIADGAENIADFCTGAGTPTFDGNSELGTSGQAFNHHNWNVIVREDKC